MRELWNRMNEKQQKLFSYLAVVLIVGVGLLLLQPTTPVGLPGLPTSESSPVVRTSDSRKETLEKELTSILDSLLGGKGTDVFLTMDRGPSLQIAYDRTEEERWGDQGLSEQRRTQSPVLMRNDADRKEVALVLEEVEPTVRGVLVVVAEAPSSELRLAVAQAVATALQVPMYRIEVLFKH